MGENTDGKAPSTGTGEARPQLATIASCLLHDFGNLLTLMSGHTELLTCSPSLDENAHDDVLSLRSAVRRSMHLVSSWSDFLRPMSTRSEVVPLDGLMSEVKALILPILSPKIHFDVDFDRRLSVHSHSEHLQRALLNLVLNARDAVGHRGTIEVRAEVAPWKESADGGIRITVKDTGKGITQANLERIRAPFFTTKTHGSGLGLAQVSDFAASADGQLDIQSELGVGSEFSLVLARGPDVSDATIQSEPPPRHQEGTILLIEPDAPLATVLTHVLERAGYSVLIAHGAGDGLLALERCPGTVHAVVADSELPWMSLRELNTRIRQQCPSIAIVTITNSPALLEGESDGVLLKPFDSKLLTETVCRLLTRPLVVSETRIRALAPSIDREKSG